MLFRSGWGREVADDEIQALGGQDQYQQTITKKEQNHRYREHISGIPWGEERREGRYKGRD